MNQVIKWLTVATMLLVTELAIGQELPVLNQKIVDYVTTVIGKKVDRGECWDLANRALTNNNAEWDGEYKYGKRIDPKKDVVLPGDIIQFENVKVVYKKGNTTTTEMMPHHTAIVYKVIAPGVYELAHQNTGFSGRKVGLSEFNLTNMVKGRIYFYRPVLKGQSEK
ncbi:MAG TPA: hypothetical protein VMW01_08700 [Williamwhitmania sp.]|nr:hypothetical protein [Williamwhitmania sp.]